MGNFFQAPNRVFDHEEFSTAAKLIILYLYRCRNTKTGEIFPSMDDIASKCSIKSRTAQRCIKQLARANYVGVISSPGKVNHYKLHSLTQRLNVTPPMTNSTRVGVTNSTH